ncbi:hypothetical protein [Acaryochloris marina]|uniref:hypothetical protein n=1 Tax=Acaryochloris marina TaxID=155978 RepID=UPI0021C47425|nr:hypothetical protein [Acaryochloris marina]BDM79037.1 hypothetical protein AM10699_19050 [Acaryochloris marina MBIC10699]
MDDSIELKVAVEDQQASDEELQAILTTLAMELENQEATVRTAEPPREVSSAGELAKGDESSSLLDIKINLDTLKGIGKWLYERLVGTTTKVKFKYGDLEFEFEGRNDQDRQSAQKDFEDFVSRIEAAKRAQNG